METIPNSSESVRNILESSVFLENVSSLLTNVSHPTNFLPIKTYIRIVNILNIEEKRETGTQCWHYGGRNPVRTSETERDTLPNLYVHC